MMRKLMATLLAAVLLMAAGSAMAANECFCGASCAIMLCPPECTCTCKTPATKDPEHTETYVTYSDLTLTKDTDVYDGFGQYIVTLPAGTVVQVFEKVLGSLHILYDGSDEAGWIVVGEAPDMTGTSGSDISWILNNQKGALTGITNIKTIKETNNASRLSHHSGSTLVVGATETATAGNTVYLTGDVVLIPVTGGNGTVSGVTSDSNSRFLETIAGNWSINDYSSTQYQNRYINPSPKNLRHDPRTSY